MKIVRHALALCIGLAVLTACGPKAAPTPALPSVEQLAATIAAATINAQLAAATASAAVTVAPPATPTVAPTLFINAATSNCRSGPGPDFQLIATYSAGASVPLFGQDTASGFWVVKDPVSNALCWISVQDGTPAGSFDALPQMTPQPVSVAVPAQPASIGRPDFACDNTTLTVVLRWQAPPGAVNGYRLFREGNQVADVPASQTEYTEKIPFVYGSSVKYAVAAYNDAGLSAPHAWEVHCP
jgi:hypothetical protein